jgi:gluconokinase
VTAAAVVVVMGVTGTGKTTIGKLLAQRLDARFAEGDDYHPPENVEKMRSGRPLDDDDRWPWLQAIADDLRRWIDDGITAVVTCSALKRSYRDVLRRAGSTVRFVFLEGDPELLRRRLAGRKGHYMPASLLPSQIETLESPVGEPDVAAVEVEGEPEEILERALKALARIRAAAPR